MKLLPHISWKAKANEPVAHTCCKTICSKTLYYYTIDCKKTIPDIHLPLLLLKYIIMMPEK